MGDFFKYIERQKKFTCQVCNNEFDVSEAIVSKEHIKSKHLSTKISGRIVTRTYLDSYSNIRYCKHCYKKKERIRKVSLITIWIITPLVYLVCSFDKLMDNGGIGNLIGVMLLACPLMCLFITMFWAFIYNGAYKIDIEKAMKDNAVDDSKL